ncbi:MAG: hypothetical protein JKY20_04340, partial [Alphaproteobacteria bacterium]|nr:hypothetical protein [Alphaproteobacteria bacterium]
LGNIQLDKPLIRFRLENGLLKITEFKTGLLKGLVSGAGVVDASSETPKISAALQIQKIDSAQIFQMMAIPARLTGPVSLEFSGGATGASEAALIAALNGSGRLTGRVQVQVSKSERSAAGVLNLASALFGKKVKELGQVGTISNALFSAFGKNPADLTADIAIRKGLVSTENGRLAGAGASALIKGVVDLPQWLIKARASMFQSGGAAALVDVDVTGSLDSPDIRLGGDILKRRDTTTSQESPLQQILPSLLGGGDGQKKPKTRDLLKGLLKGLGG